MSQPAKSRVFFIVLCLVFALAVIGTMDLQEEDDRQVKSNQRVTRNAAASGADVQPTVLDLAR